jgi:hypothetical protein
LVITTAALGLMYSVARTEGEEEDQRDRSVMSLTPTPFEPADAMRIENHSIPQATAA